MNTKVLLYLHLSFFICLVRVSYAATGSMSLHLTNAELVNR